MSSRDKMVDALLDCIASAPEPQKIALYGALEDMGMTGEGIKYINNEGTDYFVPLTKRDIECLMIVADNGAVHHPEGYALNKHETMYHNTADTVRQLIGERHWLNVLERVEGDINSRFVIHNHRTGKFRFIGFDM